jgi:hypothetical protein
MERYKQNLHIEGDNVISYTTHVATIDREAGKLYRHGYWSFTTSRHINYVAREYKLEIEDRPIVDEAKDNSLKSISLVMAFGDIFCQDKKDKNDWKIRMLKAGLENKGLIMPEDWESLAEDEKEVRLNKVIKEFR